MAIKTKIFYQVFQNIDGFCAAVQIKRTQLKLILNCKKYFTRTLHKQDKKRELEIPNGSLKALQKKINAHIQSCLKAPDYLYSGYKGSNYVKCAKVHQNSKVIATVDISDFYHSCKAEHVRSFFKNKLNTDEELTDMLVKLTTFHGSLPTGAPTSQLLAFWSYKKCFDEINELAKAKNLKMTLYVDDIGFSGDFIKFDELISEVAKILNKYGFKLNNNKNRIQKKGTKLYLGVGITKDKRLAIPNNLGFSIIKTIKNRKIKDLSPKEIARLLGLIAAAQQIEPNKFKMLKRQILKQHRKNCSIS